MTGKFRRETYKNAKIYSNYFSGKHGEIVKKLILIVMTIILYSGCANNEPYGWNKDVPFQTILAQSGGKLVLMDFETEW